MFGHEDELKARIEQLENEIKAEADYNIVLITDMMRRLDKEQRMEIMINFCSHCGNEKPCNCWRDE